MTTAVQRATVRFKQLSCLGLGGEAVMPALIREMHVIVPSLRSLFFFAKPDGKLDHIYTESMEYAAVTQRFVTEFYARGYKDPAGFGFDDGMKSQVGVYDLTRARIDINDFGRTAFYNECFRPVGRGRDYIRMVIREQGRGLGMVTTFREPGDSHFSQFEKDRLAGLEPFFAHALSGRRAAVPDLVDSGASGLIVADVAGNLLYASAMGRELLARVIHPRMAIEAGPVRCDNLPVALRVICHNLGRIMAGDDVESSPVYHHSNLWGGFTFRANLLRGETPGSRVVGITVTHQEPAGVKLVKRIGELPLTRRQSEICLELAQGGNYDLVSEKLGISKHTAVAHSRVIYDKLGVHNRAELRSRLLAGAITH